MASLILFYFVKEKPRVSYFLSHPIQYFSPLFKQMAEFFDLNVYYFSDSSVKGVLDKGFQQEIQWDTALLEGYPYRFIRNFSLSRSMNNHFFEAVNPGAVKFVRKDRSGVIIVNGWSYFSNLLVIIAGKLAGKKVWLRAENPLNQERKKNRLTLSIKRIVLGKILFKRLVDKCLYIGTENKKFFQFYGVPEHKLLYTPYAVDNDYFNQAFREVKDDLPALKRDLGLPADKKLILFAAKFIPKKRPMDLLEAFRRLGVGDHFLIMVGDGKLRPDIEAYIRTYKMDNVLLTGFVNQGSISRYYAVADVFVMCSGMGETWGLAVNEAMNFEKPIVISDTCGCCTDLVQDGVNGLVFPEGDIAAFADCLKRIIEDGQFSEGMGKASLEKVRSFSIKAIVENMEEALCQ